MSDQAAATVRNAYILLATPDELRGRIEAIRITFTAGAPAVGNLQGGAVATALGAPLAVVIGGVVVAAAVIITDRFVPAVRRAET